MVRLGLARMSNGSLPAKMSAILSATASIASQVVRSFWVWALPGASCGVALALPRWTTAFGRWKSSSKVDRSMKLSGLRGVMSPMPRMVMTTVSSVARSKSCKCSSVGIFLNNSASKSAPSLPPGQAEILDLVHVLIRDTKTVSTYRSRILQKMGLKTNADLVQYCTRHTLIK